ncbi:MAG: 4Fe-4S double cluster binding domain-containing protein [Verrucomicrobiae bacterium]|nr:4Fe-4S double cluster binding domain-containing protein [Verrucomicrobiae bacterium]
MNSSDLRKFVSSHELGAVGWFQGRGFDGYLRAVEERVEYHQMAYRPYEAFLRAGRAAERFATVIVLAVDYFYENAYPEGRFKISNYSRFCWKTVAEKEKLLTDFLKTNGFKAEPLDVPARAAACAAGLGFIGKNTMFYATGMGSYVGISVIGTDLVLAVESEPLEQVSKATCRQCNRCVESCPVKAIFPEGYRIDPLRCISFLNRHAPEPHKREPSDVRALDRWLHGCEACQDVCPVNKGMNHRKKVEFSDHLDLCGIKVPNRSSADREFIRARLPEISGEAWRQYVDRLTA